MSVKRAVIKEELVKITGDFIKAVILNQFIYWQERTNDIDKYIQQENERAEKAGTAKLELTHGWVCKSDEEIAEETMLGLSACDIQIHIKELIDMELLLEKYSPGKQKQYRVNFVKLYIKLQDLNYRLEWHQLYQEADKYI